MLGSLSCEVSDRGIIKGTGHGSRSCLLLCYLQDECHEIEDLFCKCCYLAEVWSSILDRMQLYIILGNLSTRLDWAIQTVKVKSFTCTLYRLALAASVYHLWIESNTRNFQNKARSTNY